MDLFPVGVSFIPAYIPANTLMYHASSLPDIPEGFEWIAFDWEFSYNFAGFNRGNGRSRRPPHGPGGPNIPGTPGKPDSDTMPQLPEKQDQEPLLKRGFPWRGISYFHTFRNTKPLDKVIFLDGASAAKSTTGEMDQQLILSRQKNINDRVNEYDAAEKICKWGKEFGLQGIIRLEIGFEMILCDFHTDIELVSSIILNNITELAHLPYEKPIAKTPLEQKEEKLIDEWSSMRGYEHLRAGAAVDHGDQRIKLDFSKMVTPLNQTWINADPYKRRIHNLTDSLKENIIKEISTNLREPADPFKKTDWQLLTNQFEVKFGPMLTLLNGTLNVFKTDNESNIEQALENTAVEISKITFNFVRRYSDDNIKDAKEKERRALKDAVQDYVHLTSPLVTKADNLLYSSVHRVAHDVISSIFDLFYTAREILEIVYNELSEKRTDDLKIALLKQQTALVELLSALRWSIFTRCSQTCSWDEICYTPTWGPGPLGWGADDTYFEFDGDRYRIPTDLRCVNYENIWKH